MVKIIDVNGNPIDTGKMREPQTASLGWMRQTFAGHPSRGLTPAKLARIMEAAEQGDIQSQHELFLDMEEKDGHIFAEMSKRRRALLTVDWDIAPPRNPSAKEKKAAAYIRELLSDVQNFEDVIQDALDAIGHGFACLEMEWQMLGGEWLPKAIDHRPQSWFQTDRETRTQIRLRDGSMDGAALQPFGWITHIHKAKSGYLSRAGLHRVLAWPFLFKNYSVRDLAEFLEIYGIPIRLGKYFSGASDDEKATLLQAVIDIGHNAAGIIPEGMGIEFVQISGNGSSTPFEYMVEWAERTESKVILGGTLTSQADGKTSTNALGNVHNEVRHDLMMSDARQLAGTLTRDLVYPLYALNVGGIDDIRRCPRFVFDLGEAEDLKLYSEALPNLVNAGVTIPVSWVREKLRIPEPEGDEPVLTAAHPAAPDAPPPAAATGIAAATATQENEDHDPTSSDSQTGILADRSAAAGKIVLDKVRDLVDNAESLESLRNDLLAAYGDLDSSELVNIMELAFIAADLSGRYDAQEE